ncbi:MAG TPA: type II toxin-antitoxin system VapC family toxin [Polyangia bacterium]|nr:type II toxin-antitoxin system VapC family toxin [Polyangia bacterium]
MIWLLDTNMLVYARNGVAPVVARLDDVWEQGEVVTSLLVVGELIYGVEKSIRREGNLAAVEQQLAMLDGILPLTDAIVRRFGRLKAEMGRRGIIKQDIDLHIAATAIEAGATLVTNDGALLDGTIPGLTVENWNV